MIKPDVYQAQSTLLFDNTFFDAFEVNKPNITPEIISSPSLKSKLAEYPGLDQAMVSGVNLSFDTRSSIITASQSSTDSEVAFIGVKKVSEVLNDALKQQELRKVSSIVDALQTGSSSINVSAKSQEYLDELLAQQLFKKVMLESPEKCAA